MLLIYSKLIKSKINLKKIGFTKISDSNLYIYQSDEYKILNYSIKPQLIFSIYIENNTPIITPNIVAVKPI